MSSPEPLEVAAEKYFAQRRKLGYALRSEREEVLLFARGMDAMRRRKITLPLVIDWARSARNGSPKYAAWRYEAVRRFLTVAACTRRDTVVPPAGYLGRPFGRRRPHIYATAEITALLAATSTLTPTAGLRPWTYRTLFGLLYATGCASARRSRSIGPTSIAHGGRSSCDETRGNRRGRSRCTRPS
jgi:integrase